MYSSKTAGKNKMTTIAIGKNVETELGRLLAFDANVPFNVVGFINNPDEPQWPSVEKAAIAASMDLEKYLSNTPVQNTAGKVNNPAFWMRKHDEDKLIHLIRCKIECNSYLLHLFIDSKAKFVFSEDDYANPEKYNWIIDELDFLRRYLRKSFLQGYQQPYIRPGSRKPFKWR
jgi:hypothetical protein